MWFTLLWFILWSLWSIFDWGSSCLQIIKQFLCWKLSLTSLHLKKCTPSCPASVQGTVTGLPPSPVCDIFPVCAYRQVDTSFIYCSFRGFFMVSLSGIRQYFIALEIHRELANVSFSLCAITNSSELYMCILYITCHQTFWIWLPVLIETFLWIFSIWRFSGIFWDQLWTADIFSISHIMCNISSSL